MANNPLLIDDHGKGKGVDRGPESLGQFRSGCADQQDWVADLMLLEEGFDIARGIDCQSDDIGPLG